MRNRASLTRSPGSKMLIITLDYTEVCQLFEEHTQITRYVRCIHQVSPHTPHHLQAETITYGDLRGVIHTYYENIEQKKM